MRVVGDIYREDSGPLGAGPGSAAKHRVRKAPPRLMVLIVLTNWLWIPVIVYYDLAVRKLVAAGTRGE
jgi:hypothetical protein